MPTKNDRITITVTEEVKAAITKYRFARQFNNQTQAILSLIQKGLDVCEMEDGPSSRPSGEALRLAMDYDSLGPYGQKALRQTARLELERAQAQMEIPRPLAARNYHGVPLDLSATQPLWAYETKKSDIDF